MVQFQSEIKAGRETLTIKVELDTRLSKTARWRLRDKVVYLRVPECMNHEEIEAIISDITPRLVRQRKRAQKQCDINLMERAEELNHQHFNGELSWHTIRWVKNMDRRLGSCTTGGMTDGDIRISERARQWPEYVVDYILAHEICHRKYPNHSDEFWDYLAQYPHVSKALGFIEGLSYAEGVDPDSLLD